MAEAAPSVANLQKLLDAMLQTAAEKGWTPAGVAAAAKLAGLTEGEVMLAAPRGAADLIDALFARAAGAAEARLQQSDVAGLKVREKVRVGVKAFLGVLDAHKAAVKRAGGSSVNLLAGPKGLWAGADAIWSALGDTSTDYNWYTKRTILAGVIGSTLACWTGTDDQAEIDAFLDRRIENVMQFEKSKKKVLDTVASWPNPLDVVLGKPR